MRTTLAIDDDVLAAAKALADAQKKSVGQVVSELVRLSLDRPAPTVKRNGILLLPISQPGAVVTNEIVNRLRDEEP